MVPSNLYLATASVTTGLGCSRLGLLGRTTVFVHVNPVRGGCSRTSFPMRHGTPFHGSISACFASVHVLCFYMSEDMQQDAIDCATQALEKYNIEKDIAAFIKKEFDKKYNPTWHCIVGRNFGSYCLHARLRVCCSCVVARVLRALLTRVATGCSGQKIAQSGLLPAPWVLARPVASVRHRFGCRMPDTRGQPRTPLTGPR